MKVKILEPFFECSNGRGHAKNDVVEFEDKRAIELSEAGLVEIEQEIPSEKGESLGAKPQMKFDAFPIQKK